MDPTLTDVLWLMVCAGLVFLMQAGFLCLEAGLTRTKNSINVAVKNLADFGLSAAIFWVVGFGIMFGVTHNGWFGTSLMAPEVGGEDAWLASFFLFQAMFCGTAVTIISGAVAERVRFAGYLFMAAVVSLLVYPVFGHWAWGGAYAGEPGWLGSMGFVDFAGSTVVHGVGGWVALAACLIIGPRLGHYDEQGKPRRSPSSNLPVAMLGTLLLWFGWIGFNGGSTLSLDLTVPGIIANTMLAAIAGLMASIIAGWSIDRYPHPGTMINGCLAGLVAITAGCHAVSAWEAVVIGAVGGLVAVYVSLLLDRVKIDDVIGAVPVHLAAGVWGTLAVGLFGNLDILGTGLTRWEQLGVQGIGIAVCGALSLGVMAPVLWAAHKSLGLRVTAEQERIGLNVAEHRASTELLDFIGTIDKQAKTGDLSIRAPVEPFTEVGQIAKAYNELMESLAQTTLTVEELSSMTANVPGVVYRCTADERGETHFQFMSSGCRDYFGYEPSQIIEDPRLVMDRIDPQDMPAYADEAERSSRQMSPFRWRGRVRDRHDEWRWIETMSAPRRLPDGTTRWDGVMIDITDLKAAEEELVRARNLAQDANLAKSEFLANMSHEIRTPLHGILSFAGFGLKKAGKVDHEKLEDYFRKIDVSGRRLLMLVNDLLDLAKLEAGRMSFELTRHDASIIVAGVVDEMTSLLSERNMRVNFCRPPEPIQADFDMHKLMQVVRNLINNAVKFSPADSVIEVHLQRMGELARVSVRDYGPGIPQGELDAIFDKFIQSSKTKSGAGGTGLGLSICGEIMRGHAGRIWAENAPDGGAVFSFEWPLVADEAHKAAVTRESVLAEARARDTSTADDTAASLLAA
jgi:Amt family ammonium transporter